MTRVLTCLVVLFLLGVVCIQAVEIGSLKSDGLKMAGQIGELKTDNLLFKTEAYRAFLKCEKQNESPRHQGSEIDQILESK